MTDFNNVFTVIFSDELKKARIKSTTSPQICCRTTLRKLKVHVPRQPLQPYLVQK